MSTEIHWSDPGAPHTELGVDQYGMLRGPDIGEAPDKYVEPSPVPNPQDNPAAGELPNPADCSLIILVPKIGMDEISAVTVIVDGIDSRAAADLLRGLAEQMEADSSVPD